MISTSGHTEQQKAQRIKFSRIKRERAAKAQASSESKLSADVQEWLHTTEPERRRLFLWGYTHDFPDIKASPYAIGPGMWCWGVVMHCRMEMVIRQLEVIDALDAENQEEVTI